MNPYLISLAYSLDRATAKDEIDGWLKNGKIVLADRYVTSNMVHQGAKLASSERKEFLNWLEELEYKVNKVPREDLDLAQGKQKPAFALLAPFRASADKNIHNQ